MLLPLVAFTLAADPAPAMVTMAKGPVTVVEGKTRTPAPNAPFLLAPTQSLDLGAGAHVVLLRQGGAFTADGPKVIDAAALKPAATAPAADVGALLSRRTSLAAAGAARSAGLVVTRPVPNTTALTLAEVRWRCDACGPQAVQVLDMREDAVVWAGTGEGRVPYDGPALRPGVYLVRVGGTEVSLRVAPRAEADALLAGLGAIPDPEDRAASEAGALWLAGHATDALTTLEAAGLQEMVGDYERLAGVAP